MMSSQNLLLALALGLALALVAPGGHSIPLDEEIEMDSEGFAHINVEEEDFDEAEDRFLIR